jgi:hypothetical protein
MAEHIIIVHGWSDSASGFAEVTKFLINQNFYQQDKIKVINYKSLDDQATLEDFADKFDDFFQVNYKNNGIDRVDIICHSTGSLVVRSWLALRRLRQRRRNQSVDVPVEHFFMFAPANFGSDLALLGQSGLHRLRTAFQIKLNDDTKVDRFEVGEKVLQALEPASPSQWKLSNIDLHEETYFGQGDETQQICYAFVFAAANPKQEFFKFSDSQQNFVRRFIPIVNNPSTDSTVRICGTSLNTRKVIIRQDRNNPKKASFEWSEEKKFSNIPFAVFPQYNHGEVVKKGLTAQGDGEVLNLFKQAYQVNSLESYQAVSQVFSEFTKSKHNSSQANQQNKQRFQQLFFKVKDDVDFDVIDFFIDFVVYRNNQLDTALTEEIDKHFDNDGNWYSHSVDKSCKVLLVDYDKLNSFFNRVVSNQATVVLNITAKSISNEINFDRFNCPIVSFDNISNQTINFLYPNTTTLVEIILNRGQHSNILG